MLNFATLEPYAPTVFGILVGVMVAVVLELVHRCQDKLDAHTTKLSRIKAVSKPLSRRDLVELAVDPDISGDELLEIAKARGFEAKRPETLRDDNFVSAVLSARVDDKAVDEALNDAAHGAGLYMKFSDGTITSTGPLKVPVIFPAGTILTVGTSTADYTFNTRELPPWRPNSAAPSAPAPRFKPGWWEHVGFCHMAGHFRSVSNGPWSSRDWQCGYEGCLVPVDFGKGRSADLTS